MAAVVVKLVILVFLVFLVLLAVAPDSLVSYLLLARAARGCAAPLTFCCAQPFLDGLARGSLVPTE